jgi:superfamily II DNA/RNA helicase
LREFPKAKYMSYDPVQLQQQIVEELENRGHISALGLTRRNRGITGVGYSIICKAISQTPESKTVVSYYYDHSGETKRVDFAFPIHLKTGSPQTQYAEEKFSPKIKVTKTVRAVSNMPGSYFLKVSVENESKTRYAKRLSISEFLEGAEVVIDRGRPRIVSENLIYEELVNPREVRFTDHILLPEQHLSIKYDEASFAEFASKNGIPEAVVKAFEFDRLMQHQSEAYLVTKEIYENSLGKTPTESPHKSILISVRTAGGKTEAFLLHPLTLLAKKPRSGVFAIIMYPTKALANDQAKRIFRYVALINRAMGEARITMGVYHGDTMTEQDEVKAHPFKSCPICRKRLRLKETKSRYSLECDKCGSFPYVSLTKSEIERELPNILITNPDMMHYRLTNFWNHSFFGKIVSRCNRCFTTAYNPANLLDEKTGLCKKCGGVIESIQSKPMFLIIDEVHLFRGSFGSHVGTLVSELSRVINEYTGSEPIVVGSSATIDQADIKRIGQHLLGKEPVFVPSKPVYEKKLGPTEIKRFHLFLMPQGAYWRYTIFGIALAIDAYRQALKQKVPTLIFANTVKDANNLEKAIAENTTMVTKAHTAELSKSTRQKIEEWFSNGDLDVLAATKTLEVGVDFDNIRVLILVGAPFSYNDFIQRIGRAGRGDDAALVITVLRPFIPLDSYYFENCRDLLDPERSGLMEAFPIQRNNPFIVRRHIRDSILSYIYTKDSHGASSYYQRLRSEIIGVNPKYHRDEIMNWLTGIFEPEWIRDAEREEIHEVLMKDVDGFYEHLKNRQPRDANEYVFKHFERDLMFSLRTNDDLVAVVSNTDPDKVLRLTADRFVLPTREDDEFLAKEEEVDTGEKEETELHVGDR